MCDSYPNDTDILFLFSDIINVLLVCVLKHGLLDNKENRKNPALIAYAAKVNATLSFAVICFKPL